MAEPKLKLYTIKVNGIEHVVQLSPDDAEAQGAVELKRPANKAGAPSTKA